MIRLHELMGYGLATAFFSACAGIDGIGQFIFFALGVSWGHMMITIDGEAR